MDESVSEEMQGMKLLKYPPETPEQRLICEIGFLFVIIFAVGLFGRAAALNVTYTIILSVIFAINITIRFILVNERGDWMFFLLGVIGGGGNDLMSMLNGVYDYTSITIIPFLQGLMPLWMILFWGQVFLLFRKIFHLNWFAGSRFKKNGRFVRGWVDNRLIFDIILVIVLRVVIYNTYDAPIWISGLAYGIGVFLRLIIFPLRRNEWLIVVILPYAFLFEGLMVTFGLYIYINPVFLGMPLWLYLWWIVLVPCLVKELFDRLEYLQEVR